MCRVKKMVGWILYIDWGTASASSQSNELIDLERKPIFARMKIDKENKFFLNSPWAFCIWRQTMFELLLMLNAVDNIWSHCGLLLSMMYVSSQNPVPWCMYVKCIYLWSWSLILMHLECLKHFKRTRRFSESDIRQNSNNWWRWGWGLLRAKWQTWEGGGPGSQPANLDLFLMFCNLFEVDLVRETWLMWPQYIAVPRLFVIWVVRQGTGWRPPIRVCKIDRRPWRPKLTNLDPVFCKKSMSIWIWGMSF